MIITGISFDEFSKIVEDVSADYGNNLAVAGRAHVYSPRRFRARIRAIESGAATLPLGYSAPGARRSAGSDRRGPWACWHANRDVMRAVFELNPDARIQTPLAVYRGAADFEAQYRSTGYRNIGNMFNPRTMPELCDCDNSIRDRAA